MWFTHIDEKLKTLLGDLYRPVMSIAEIIGIIALSIVIVKVGSYVIRKFFERKKFFKNDIQQKKIITMSTLLLSVFRYTVYIISTVVVLTDVFKLTSVLAAAGIGGIAIGFGAQSLIKDIISGFFIIFEDQYAVGDLITVDDMTGTVEEMELRVTKLRNFNGDLYVIPNGEIKKVTNHTRGNKAVIVDIPLAYSSDAKKAVEAADRACAAATGEFDTIVEPPKVLGITELGSENMTLRIFAKTVANAQWEVERRIRMLIRDEFSREKIAFYDRNKLVIDNNAGEGGNANGG